MDLDESDQVVEQTPAPLRRHGVSGGNCVHQALSNCPAFVAVWLAVSRLGAWMVAADPRATTDEISWHLARNSSVVGVVAPSRDSTYRAAVSQTTPITLLIVDEVASDVAPGSSLFWPSDRHLSFTPEPSVGDRLAVMFTSGTTSAPKGVVLSQGPYARTGAVMAAASRLSQEDGVDGIYVGPRDLALSLGRGEPGDLAYMSDVVAGIVTTCVEAGTPVGVHASFAEQTSGYRKMGATILTAAANTAVLAAAFDAQVNALRLTGG